MNDAVPGGSDVKSVCLHFGRPRVRSLGRDDPLEQEVVTHSRILARQIPWTEEPSKLQSMGSQRVGQDRVTSLSLSCYYDLVATVLLCFD